MPFRLNLRKIRKLFVLLYTLLGGTFCFAQGLHSFVDPSIGSEGPGRTFIGPCAPFGMVKPGPDCVSMPNAGWAPMPEVVKGFSQTHVSGTGGGQKYGNVLIQPILFGDTPVNTGLLLPSGEVAQIPVYGYWRTSEDVELGYYTCTYDNGICTEITTAERCAFYRFSGADALLVDAASFLGMDTIPNKREAQQYVASMVTAKGKKEICGYTTVRGGWNNGDAYTVYFCLRSDRPFKAIVDEDEWGNPTDDRYLIARLSDRRADIKVGISYVSVDQARRNILPHGFDARRTALRKQWDGMLGKVPYHGTDKEKRMFFTALYHTLLMPVDKTGENPKWEGGPYYDDYYALWDTYRTSFPLLMDYYPDRAVSMINSLLAIYRHEGYMPDARSGDCNGRTQGGSHADVVIADAFVRGLKGIDYELALQAMIKDAEVPPADDEKEGRGGLEEYNRLGYIPYGIPRAGTRTVEYSFDDWCIARVARGLGHADFYDKYMARSHNWCNLWRADYEWQGMRGFIMPRDAEGRWLDSVLWGKSQVFHPHIPYKPDTKVAPWYIAWWDTFFYEALSAEYSLSVPHDVPALIELCGGDSAFRRRLDTFFENGHYNVANEPSFLTPYLYHYIGRPDLSARRVSQIINANFSDRSDGLPGNDDSGAMSAWLVWAMLGKYPVPVSPIVSGESDASFGAHYLSIPPVRIQEPCPTAVQSVPKGTTPPLEAVGGAVAGRESTVSFTLNRQYRTWPLSSAMRNDTLFVRCNGCLYAIPDRVVSHSTGFSWDSPQRPGASYVCDGTFLFVSRDALRTLLDTRAFVYDGIIWREQERTEDIIRVKADADGTEMWLSLRQDLPWVVKMKGNPLGIDWTLNLP